MCISSRWLKGFTKRFKPYITLEGVKGATKKLALLKFKNSSFQSKRASIEGKMRKEACACACLRDCEAHSERHRNCLIIPLKAESDGDGMQRARAEGSFVVTGQITFQLHFHL